MSLIVMPSFQDRRTGGPLDCLLPLGSARSSHAIKRPHRRRRPTQNHHQLLRVTLRYNKTLFGKAIISLIIYSFFSSNQGDCRSLLPSLAFHRSPRNNHNHNKPSPLRTVVVLEESLLSLERLLAALETDTSSPVDVVKC